MRDNMPNCPEFQNRRADYPIDTVFLRRWSPRAMSGEAVTQDELFTVLEAARWAPSAHNEQPWRFLYALRGDAAWTTFLTLLNSSHRRWIPQAGAMVIIVSNMVSEHQPDGVPTYSFDAGLACENACLQATSLGLVSHVVQLQQNELVRRTLVIPDEYSVEFGLVLGRPGKRTDLAAEYQAKEAPRLRRPLSEMVFRGGFSPGGREPAGR
jgi:nitroreductase